MPKRKNSCNIRRRGKSWQVDCGRFEGRRLQRQFRTRAEAEEWAAEKSVEVSNNRFASFQLSDAHRYDALQAYGVMAKALGKTVDDLPTGEITLTRAAESFVKHAFPKGGQRMLSQVSEEYLQSKVAAGRRPRTISDLNHRVKRFVRTFGDKPVHTITTADLEQWLNFQKYSGITRRDYRTHFVMFFNYARRHKYVSENPAEDLLVPSIDEKMPEVLTVDECHRFMNAVQDTAPRMIPYCAIALFAGLRPAEVSLLDWKNINFEARLITVSPEIAKRRRVRHVDMSENLIVWLLPHRRATGQIHYIRKDFERARREAGIKWPHNAMRHSFASYHLAMHEDAARTSLQLGHRGQDILFNHYRGLVRKQDAEQFWKIRPCANAKVIRMPA